MREGDNEKMTKFIMASHGSLSSGFKSSVEVLLGSSDDLIVFDAYTDERDPKTEIEKMVASTSNDEVIVLLSDILGGSVNQIMMNHLERPNTYLLTGINLACLVELIVNKEKINKGFLNDILQQSRAAMTVIELDVLDDEKEEFF